MFLVGGVERHRGGARAARRGAHRPRPALAVRAGDARDLARRPRARRGARRRLRRRAPRPSPTSLPPDMRASMLHDLEAGGKLEAPWLCGAVARMAREAGHRRAGEPRGVRRAQAVREWICASFRPRAAGPALRHDPPRAGTPPEQVDARPTSSPRASPACRSTAWWSTTSRTRPGARRRRARFLHRTIDPRDYARLFQRPAIVYKALGTMDEPRWRQWLAESRTQRASSCRSSADPLPARYAAAAVARDPHRLRESGVHSAAW